MGGAQTGGVYEAEEVAAYGHRLFHGVAGGAGVDGSHYGDRNTVAKGVAVAEGVCQRMNMPECAVQQG